MTERKHYLPTWATTDEACTWLEAQTGEAWPLARLLESWLMPSVWLEYSPDAPKEVFGDRTEGFLAPMPFAGDMNRLAITRSGLLTLTKLPDGRLFRATPGLEFDLSELRYSAEDLARMVQSHAGQEAPAKSPAEIAKRHAELSKETKAATKQTAEEFGVSDSYVRQCVRDEKAKPRSGMVAMAEQLTPIKKKRAGV
jgi:hypothetical protein